MEYTTLQITANCRCSVQYPHVITLNINVHHVTDSVHVLDLKNQKDWELQMWKLCLMIKCLQLLFLRLQSH